MADKELVKELDRNMDTVFDNLYVINAAMEALAQSLPPQSAALLVNHLDAALKTIGEGINPPSSFHQGLLVRWQLLAAQRAEQPDKAN